MESRYHKEDDLYSGEYAVYDDDDALPNRENDEHYYNDILDNVDPTYNEGHHVDGFGGSSHDSDL